MSGRARRRSAERRKAVWLLSDRIKGTSKARRIREFWLGVEVKEGVVGHFADVRFFL